ncbi:MULTISPECIES: AraC family transcriptional regulator [unclassified Bradyrhizobium]|uniref:AraC family transcriptional regulator n=1 Tax=unclassified Bradyrhizobium TaxID=2631580 RepID=UPI0029165810|nr:MULTISPECIES: AraC family transcriptional regulator [unclassified Bradyrhizobium]
MDFLTSIVSAMHLRSALYARFEVRAPWAVEFAPGKERARFGLVTEGVCWLKRTAHPPLRLHAGDLFLILDADTFALGDEIETPTRTCASLMNETRGDDGIIRFGGSGVSASFVTGWFGFNASTGKPLVELLPELLHFRLDEERNEALRATFSLLARETVQRDAGSDVVVRGLADVLFVQAVRAYMASAPEPRHRLLAALANPRLSRAIHAMHATPEKPWKVESLASVAGMSRSAFAAAFRSTLEQTPLEYLARWRVHVAKRLLIETEQPLATIAHDLGYGSDNAFAKVFCRIVGVTPAVFRRKKTMLMTDEQGIGQEQTGGQLQDRQRNVLDRA